LPVELEKILKPTDPQEKKVDVVQVDVLDGDSSNVSLCTATEPITLLINREGKTIGKQYDDAKGLVRITATHDGSGGVKLKVVPLIQHGPTKKAFGAAQGGQFQPQEFIVKDGQAEDPFRDISATVTLKPGQVLAIGGKADSALSLGGFLFSQIDSTNEKSEQRVVLVWAQPSAGIPENAAPARSFLNWAEKPKNAPAKLKLPFVKVTELPKVDAPAEPEATKAKSKDSKSTTPTSLETKGKA
jgi:hypothetical protein